MKQDKWEEIKNTIKDKFEILEEKIEPLEMKIGVDKKIKTGNKEIIVFISPIGKIKLEYIVKPVIIDKKELYSKRAGTSARTEYTFSDTEFVRRMEAFKYQDSNDNWQKIDANSFT